MAMCSSVPREGEIHSEAFTYYFLWSSCAPCTGSLHAQVPAVNLTLLCKKCLRLYKSKILVYQVAFAEGVSRSIIA